ncbi:MAG: NAD(P)/FAD-dependent oxidoreductase, partial [Bacteroidota bacterium]|nr:NAD(P)/FAD-dependent oxidoreductase [Bacteroidota bacterium]
GLFMNQAGFKVLMVSLSDEEIGGDCLNDGCVPSKALIHVAKIAHQAKQAKNFGLEINGSIDMEKAISYVYERQEEIRVHENATWLKGQGIHVALGEAHFTGKKEIEVNEKKYTGKKIVIATGSTPRKLKINGVEKVKYYDNENLFHTDNLPQSLLVVGGGPIGIEMSQALSRLGSKVTVVDKAGNILEHDDKAVTKILLEQLKKEGIEFFFNAEIKSFSSEKSVEIEMKDGARKTLEFDAVFVAIGRELNIEKLQLNNAGIEVKDHKIVVNKYLRTTNKNVFVCGDVAGDLQFSHAAEFHARILLNNFFSPLNKKLNNDHMSWVTFTDPELATFGLSEKQLKERHISYERLEQNFEEDDRAVTDNYRYAKTVMFISSKGFLKKQKILGGTMVAPNAGELIQELILANTEGLSINALFNKIYPYPVASRINQKVIVEYKSKSLTSFVKKLLQFAYKIFS